ncbi:6586_t:CDS:2 [Racocetra fulgida]|uniref:6586_t:CDS:1 n=1 Tax=Racocetra fulgida TaxID=60492 RepID=A0A9N9FT95_9GLOM|nr:6586_t:CDS:2 [Racocetra fulgida]
MCHFVGFDKSTYEYFWELAKQDKPDVTGVMVIDEFEYWEKLPNNFVEPWYSKTCHGAKITDINECVKKDTDIVINCSGLDSKKLGGVKDENLYPVRGQSVTVQSCLKWACFRRGYNGDPDIDDNVAEQIIQRCLATRRDLLPEGKTELTIIGHRAG